MQENWLVPKNSGTTGGYIINSIFYDDLPGWYQQPWTMYQMNSLPIFEILKHLYQTQEFDPFISSHRIFIPKPNELDIMFRAWQLGMTTDEYKQKTAVLNILTTCKYTLLKPPDICKVTTDMIHFPEGWIHVKKPWDDDNVWDFNDGHYFDNREERLRAARYMIPNKRI